MLYKLGKHPPRRDARTLWFGKYLTNDLPTPAPSIDWTTKVAAWGMMKNDSVGDCTCAAAGHLIMEWTADCGNEVTPSDTDVLAAYSAITGYDPVTGNNDNGANELDVLNYWRKTGIAGHVIGAYAKLGTSANDIKLAIQLFGGAYLGVALPQTAQGQATWGISAAGGPAAEPGSWGGHAVPAIGYDEDTVTVITWGAPLKMTWAFFAEYVDEAYVILSPDFVTGAKPSPSGFDMATLQADLNSLQS